MSRTRVLYGNSSNPRKIIKENRDVYLVNYLFFLAHVRTICGQFHGDNMPVRLKNAKFYLSSKLYICNNPRLNLAEKGNNYEIYILIHRRPDKKNMHKYHFLHKVYEC